MSTKFVRFQFCPTPQRELALLTLAACAWLCAPAPAHAASLALPEVQPDHTVRLTLTNAAPTNYLIEAWANLLSWFKSRQWSREQWIAEVPDPEPLSRKVANR